jgi:subtilisin-like proprotein convertase family protein
VAGILALGKQAQPKLNTRFAKHLLARTSVVVDPDDQSDTGFWQTNAAGYNFNPNYGFGLIDADAFTREAVRYSDVTPLASEIVDTKVVNRAIPDSDFIVEKFTLTGQKPLEELEIHLDIDHGWRGSLVATLFSPSGAASNLMLPNEYDSFDEINWTFVTNAFWGEIPAGEWELYIGDVAEDGFAGTWNSFRVLARTGTLIPIVTIPGDYNGDRVVNAADYVVWRNTLGSTTDLFADGNGDRIINQADYTVWRAHFGRSSGASSSSSLSNGHVPEPNMAWFVFLVAGLVASNARQGRWRAP